MLPKGFLPFTRVQQYVCLLRNRCFLNVLIEALGAGSIRLNSQTVEPHWFTNFLWF